ncbi:hypothetical protein [Aquihabitans sp. McL0605]|uniref:hypothetical protein n=1 Tax=Aquihabitans sp. McL0605 TaxID=3415671 RepID=UPI003CF20E66
MRSRVSHHRLAGTDRLRRCSERGAALVIALVMIIVLGVILAGLLTYSGTSVSSDRTYSTIRKQRYAGDNAIRAAVNWVRDQPKLARDPALSVNDPACVYHVPSEVGTITTSCAADRNGGSGKPSQGGLVPDNAIVALGAQQNESKNQGSNQYNNSGCGSDFVNFFSPESPEPSAEPSILLQYNSVKQPNGVGFVCQTRSRPAGEFTVNGNVLAAGNIKATAGFNIRTDTTHSVQAKAGCVGTSPLCAANSGLSVTDPAAGDSAWDHVPINWDNVRTNPYWWNGTSLVQYTDAEGCSTRGGVIIFQPGWYKDANVINKYTANPACSDRTIWFAPEPGPDGLLQTTDDVTGAYYFGFQNTSASYSCNMAATQSHRLCIGGSATQTPRVVAGGVKIGSTGTGGFNPLAVPGSGSSQTVTLNQATTVDSGLSQSWSNADGAKLIGDGGSSGNVATYSASFCIPLFGCRSTDRSIRVRNFAPQVVTGPDKVGSNPGPIFLQVAHQEDAGSGITPSVEVRAVGPESGRQASCGTFTLPQRTTMTTDTFTANQASALGACLSSADLINGMQVTYRATGNGGNSGSPKVRLDGVKAYFSTTPTTSFPASVGSSGTAAVDCDPEGAGAQFILGGDSHIYVADGNLQVCAGAFPTNPEDHQQIGIWEAPALPPIQPSTVAVDPSTSGAATTLANPNNAKVIAESSGGSAATANLRRSSSCDNNGITCLSLFGFVIGGGGTNTASANFNFDGYTPPAGMAIDSVQLRAAYTNAPLFNILGVITPGSSAKMEVQGCAASDMGVTLDNSQTRSKAADVTSCLTGDHGGGSLLSTGFTVAWRASRTAICAPGGSCTGGIDEKLDGIQMLVNLKPVDANSRVVVPASGCVRGLPNYWAGLANPDCAVLKADSTVQNTPIPLLQTDESKWFGRFSIQGTVYAPSGALEIDDSDAAYPSVTRGIVVRHLRVTGYAKRAGYTGSSVDVVIKKDTAPREATFTSCIQSAARVTANAPCSTTDGDRVLTRSRVRFEIDPATANNPAVQPKANIPQTLWWSTKH